MTKQGGALGRFILKTGTWANLARGLVASAVLLVGGSAAALTIDFDGLPGLAPSSFDQVAPGTGFGPELTVGTVELSGGVIGLAVAPSDDAATTGPNYYATTDFLPLADGSLLPGEITGLVLEPIQSITLDVGNGNLFPAEFTLSAYAGSALVAQDSVSLLAFSSGEDFVGQLAVVASGITRFTITSNQPGGAKVFTIDTVVLSIPEPGTALLVGVGLSVLGIFRRQGAIRMTRPQSRRDEFSK